MAKYFDVHPENPQQRTISTVADSLRSGALIAYPTDSCFALGCQLGSREGIDRIRSIRNLDDRHHFTLVCQNFAQLGQFVQIDNDVFRAIKAATPGSYTFILPATREVPRRCCTRRRRRSAYGSPTMSSPRRCSPSSVSRCSPAPCSCPTRTSR